MLALAGKITRSRKGGHCRPPSNCHDASGALTVRCATAGILPTVRRPEAREGGDSVQPWQLAEPARARQLAQACGARRWIWYRGGQESRGSGISDRRRADGDRNALSSIGCGRHGKLNRRALAGRERRYCRLSGEAQVITRCNRHHRNWCLDRSTVLDHQSDDIRCAVRGGVRGLGWHDRRYDGE